jgi:hypothetical protein
MNARSYRGEFDGALIVVECRNMLRLNPDQAASRGLKNDPAHRDPSPGKYWLYPQMSDWTAGPSCQAVTTERPTVLDRRLCANLGGESGSPEFAAPGQHT